MSVEILPFDAEELVRALDARRNAFRIEIRRETDSTNEDLRALAARGAPPGTVVISEAQTAGRGRRGRAWSSPPGLGLYLSILLRPDRPPAELPRWTLAGAVAGREACTALSSAPVGIKWPNDLLCRGKKIGGVLAESRGLPSGLEIVLGVGINVSQRAGDFPDEIRRSATSLAMESDPPAPTREGLAAAFLVRLDALHRQLERGEWEPVRVRWERAAVPFRDRRVEVTSASAGPFRGRVLGLAEDGSLEVEGDDGRRGAAFSADSVRWLED